MRSEKGGGLLLWVRAAMRRRAVRGLGTGRGSLAGAIVRSPGAGNELAAQYKVLGVNV
jgi:hypothetical protein